MSSKKYISYFLLVICFILLGCVPLRYSKPQYESRDGVYHIVKKGETLWRISQTYKVDVKKIIRANKISDPGLIKVGQKLYIPGAREVKKVEAPRAETTRSLKSKVKYGKVDFIWPVKGEIISDFGTRGHQRHLGIDIKAPAGTAILAACSGKITYSGSGLRGYGNMIIIEHDQNFSTIYAHNSVNLVKQGAQVEKGQIIGYVGSTGRATTPHLHFEIRKNLKAENPLIYLPRYR